MEEINIGIIGFGTVGAGTVLALMDNKDIIKNRVGSEIRIKRIADLDTTSDRGIALDPGILNNDASELINDPDIHIVVELMGGIETAKKFIIEALEKGKHVVTANKALLAEHGSELYNIAEENNVCLAFEASVGGGIPILRALNEGLSANNINYIIGILNGTSNYILTRMAQDNMAYSKAVEKAIELGFAEDPPTLDVDGTDAAHKLAILISLAFGTPAPFEQVYKQGIDQLTPQDIVFAKEFGYCIKLLAIYRKLEDSVEARVHPSMIPLDHIMANVNEAFNAIYLEGDFVGPNLFYGLGAGKEATGSAVVSDIISLARQIRQNIRGLMPPLAHETPLTESLTIKPVENLRSAYYFRFSAVDSPGVLSKISGILGDQDISISSVIQKGRETNGPVPIVMLTHEALESNVNKALGLLDQMDILTDKTIVIRVEETLK